MNEKKQNHNIKWTKNYNYTWHYCLSILMSKGIFIFFSIDTYALFYIRFDEDFWMTVRGRFRRIIYDVFVLVIWMNESTWFTTFDFLNKVNNRLYWPHFRIIKTTLTTQLIRIIVVIFIYIIKYTRWVYTGKGVKCRKEKKNVHCNQLWINHF